MKKIKFLNSQWEAQLQNWWDARSEKGRRKIILLLFAGYLVMTAAMIISLIYQAKTSGNDQSDLGHIINPTLKNKTVESRSLIHKK